MFIRQAIVVLFKSDLKGQLTDLLRLEGQKAGEIKCTKL
jgi:hypothetical protein